MKSNVSSSPAPGRDTSFRHLLQSELARRCADNPRYSLRAFARDLECDHSTLSQWLRGARRLTETSIRLLGRRLRLDEARVETFVASAPLHEPTREHDEREIQELARDTANLISDWYHYAILELVHVEGFRPDFRWIGRVLDIDVDRVALAVQRLLHLRLLEMTSSDHWTDLSGNTRARFEDFTDAALRHFAEEVRRLQLERSHELPPESHFRASTTLAIDTAHVAEARRRMERFHTELVDLLHESGRDDVYYLELSLFPLTRLQAHREP